MNGLISFFSEQGVSLTNEEAVEMWEGLNQAILNKTLIFIIREGRRIGFFTYTIREGIVFINDMLIICECRNKNNFFHLRRTMREWFPHAIDFVWHSKRRDRYCSAK
jgi:hypothetical protein